MNAEEPNTLLDQRPRVSVCCAWYNRADYIRDTVESLLTQNYASFEVVLVNDGSPDPRVRAILASYSDPRLRVIHQENTGFVRAIRRAIDESRGEYIAIQGAGDVSMPGRLRVQAEFLDANPSYGIVACLHANVWVGGIKDGQRRPAKDYIFEPGLQDFLGERNPFSHGEVMFRGSIYDKVGGYRAFFKFAQDRDLWIRMSQLARCRTIEQELYERRNFTADGVSQDPHKQVMQRKLSAFAQQCYFDKVRYGTDYIDRFGELGALYRRNSVYVSNMCSRIALKSMLSDDFVSAAYFAGLSWEEKKTVRSIVTLAVVRLCRVNGPIRSLIMAAVKKTPRGRALLDSTNT